MDPDEIEEDFGWLCRALSEIRDAWREHGMTDSVFLDRAADCAMRWAEIEIDRELD
jgi:hypothetical protein